MSAVAVGYTWIWNMLATDPQLTALISGRLYRQKVPQGATFPALTIVHMGTVDVNNIGPHRSVSTAIFALKGSTLDSNISVLEQIDKRVDAVLMGARGPTTGGYVASCIRTGQRDLEGQDAGVLANQLISTYQLQILEG